MEELTGLGCHYDAGGSTLALSGTLAQDDWPRLWQELETAFRRTACQLTVDLSGLVGLSAHEVGRFVQVCNRSFPGTLVRPPATRPAAPLRVAHSAA